MKNSLLCLMGAMALTLVSCDPVNPVNPEEDGVFHATFDDVVLDTRTVCKDDGKVLWSPAQKIGVFQGNYSPKGGYVFTSTNTEPQSGADFEGEMERSEGDYWAFSPYNSAIQYVGTELKGVPFSNNQTGIAGTYDDQLFVSVARSATNNLVFSHPLGGVKFSVGESGVWRAILTSRGGRRIGCDRFSVLHDGETVSIEDISGTSDTIVMLPEGGEFEPGAAYYFVTLPAELPQGYTLLLEKKDGGVLEYTSGSTSVSRGTFKSLTVVDAGKAYDKQPISMEPAKATVPSEGGEFTITVTFHGEYHVDASGCAWVSPKGVTETSPGVYVHTFTAQENKGAARSGVITVCDDSNCFPFMVSQDAAPMVHHSLGMRFTATWCGYCPIMNESFALARNRLGDKFEIVNFHATNSTLPFSDTPTLMTQYNVGGYPTGIIDGRKEVQNYASSTAAQMVVNAVNETEQNYPVRTSIGISSTVSGRQVNVHLKVFAKVASEYKITVLLLEDGIVASQADYTNGTQPNYIHNNTARVTMSASIQGDEFKTTFPMKMYETDYSANVPSGYKLEKMKVLAYVQTKYGTQKIIRTANYGDWYMDNCRTAPLGASVDPEVPE